VSCIFSFPMNVALPFFLLEYDFDCFENGID